MEWGVIGWDEQRAESGEQIKIDLITLIKYFIPAIQIRVTCAIALYCIILCHFVLYL